MIVSKLICGAFFGTANLNSSFESTFDPVSYHLFHTVRNLKFTGYWYPFLWSNAVVKTTTNAQTQPREDPCRHGDQPPPTPVFAPTWGMPRDAKTNHHHILSPRRREDQPPPSPFIAPPQRPTSLRRTTIIQEWDTIPIAMFYLNYSLILWGKSKKKKKKVNSCV